MPSSVAELQALLAAERAAAGQRISELEKERDNLHASHERLRQELELFKRRLFIAKAERVDTKQLEMEFAEKLRELDAVAGTLGIAADGAEQADAEDDAKARRQKARQAQEQSRHGPARPS
jgi:chromosome segregation ATPase